MSTIPVRTLRPEIKSVLHSLRTKIQIYLLFHGLALVLVALCASFLGTLAFDWIQFQIRKLELPVAFRVVLAIAVLGGICWTLAHWLILRLLSSKKPHGLALILEKRFPDLNDRLITAVEFSDGREHFSHTPLSEAMVDHTVSSVAASTKNIELGDVFDWKPLIVAWVAAVVTLGGTAATIAAAPQSFERWTKAFVYFDEIYWLRETKLEIVVLADPGDRSRPFVEGVYLHPRGAELKLLVTVPDEERPMGGKWLAPELVEIDYEFEQGRGGDSKILARRGDREFQFKMPSVLEGFRFWITGNDYINRTPYRIILVDPPEAESISLNCDYPDYTRLDLDELDRLTLKDEQIDVPVETWFELELRTNKPLKNATLQAGPYEFALGQFSEGSEDQARLRIYSEGDGADSTETLPEDFVKSALSSDRRTVTLPFILSTHTQAAIDERGASRLSEQWSHPWILPPDSQVKIYLEDTDGIISAEPIKFAIRGQIDQPPQVVESDTYGIGTAVTRKASIPIKGFITDDYGIDVAVFHFKVDDAEEFRTRPFKNRPTDSPREFRLQGNEREAYERFDVLSTDLVEGQKLTIALYARDGDTLNGPHETHGREFTFRIVTADEILALLYEREINLRRQFEQIISEVERTRKDLLDHRELYDEMERLKASTSRTTERESRIGEIEVALVNCAERSLFQIGKNRAETASVRDAFDNMLEELVNNGVNTRQMTESLNQSIISPLKMIVEGPAPDTKLWETWNEHNLSRINMIMNGGPEPKTPPEIVQNFEGNFPDTDTIVGLFRQAMEERGDPRRQL
ncbi:MAG TPA: hypothetical protein VMM56_05135, partial [Planctomycetaceae bacterium]|nr:hypothetical protein [Planctomycetaceae bacterium]